MGPKRGNRPEPVRTAAAQRPRRRGAGSNLDVLPVNDDIEGVLRAARARARQARAAAPEHMEHPRTGELRPSQTASTQEAGTTNEETSTVSGDDAGSAAAQTTTSAPPATPVRPSTQQDSGATVGAPADTDEGPPEQVQGAAAHTTAQSTSKGDTSEQAQGDAGEQTQGDAGEQTQGNASEHGRGASDGQDTTTGKRSHEDDNDDERDSKKPKSGNEQVEETSSQANPPPPPPRNACEEFTAGLARMRNLRRQSSSHGNNLVFFGQDLFQEVANQAIAAVTEAVSAMDAGGPVFSLFDPLLGPFSPAQTVARPRNDLIYCIRTAKASQPVLPGLASQFPGSGGHLSLLIFRPNSGIASGFEVDRYDSSNFGLRDVMQEYTQTRDLLLRTQWLGPNPPASAQDFAHVNLPGNGARQRTNWACGLHAVFNGWIHALGLERTPFHESRTTITDEFYQRGVEVVNLALHGFMSATIIRDFLACYRLIQQDSYVPPERNFAWTTAVPSAEVLSELSSWARIGAQLDDLRENDDNVPPLEALRAAYEDRADIQLTEVDAQELLLLVRGEQGETESAFGPTRPSGSAAEDGETDGGRYIYSSPPSHTEEHSGQESDEPDDALPELTGLTRSPAHEDPSLPSLEDEQQVGDYDASLFGPEDSSGASQFSEEPSPSQPDAAPPPAEHHSTVARLPDFPPQSDAPGTDTDDEALRHIRDIY